MGVRGLSTWLHEYGTHAANLTQLDGAILLVDGNGLAFALLDAPEHAMRARACDYGALDRAARAVLTNLQRANAVVELYFDGAASHHKAAQLAHRGRQRAARAESLRADCLDRVTVRVDKLPEPEMLNFQLIATAESLGIPTHRCAGEADNDLARACAAATAAGAECWVVGEDSDFLFYRGIRYLRLSELQLRSGGETCSIYSASVPGAGRLELIGRGWSRSLLSELSELPEALLPDWAAIAGNDFTHSFPLASYGQSTVDAFDTGDGVTSRRPTAEEARLWLQEKAGSSTDLPRDWLAAEAEPALQAALSYSRATYDLSEDSSLDDAAAATNSYHAEVEVLVGCTTGAAADIDVTTVGGAALAELMDGLQGRVIARIDGKKHPECESSPRPHQLEALRRISRNERLQLDADSGSSSVLHGLAWEDVAVASCYQRLCSLLLRSDALEPVAPSSLFDGPSFYTFCSEARQIELAHFPPTPSRQPIVPVPAAVTVAVDMAAYGASTHLAGLCLRCGAAGAVALADDGNSYCLQCHARRAAGIVDDSDEGEPIQRQPSEEAAVQRGQLPVDGYADTILKSIRDHRVSIIAGETGCGKSSRIPELLLEDSPNARIMVAQPRRIAAHSLFTRARTVGSFPDEVGLRMGHGVRDEGPRTRLWYVTTGYLVRYVSTGIRRGNLNGLTHLVVDECHERSTETELLCLLARRLLARLPHLRVVLMSATLDEALYMPYFRSAVGPTGVAPSLFVGARRFPVTEYCLEDLFSLDALPNSIVKAAGRLQQACDKLCAVDCDSDDSDGTEEEDAAPLPLPSALVTVQLELALWITRLAPQRRDGNGGVAVLIFVAGMAEIEELAEALADKESYIFCPIHSELPFDETLEAFEPAPAGKTKVVVATNAAESSVTIPDVDLVIDLGAIKRLQYDSARQSACLCREWTSRAAAQQRAGRTGRVRPGEVWRLYPRAFMERHLRPQEPSQIKRQPLENTILAIRSAVDQEQSITSLMGELLEPPSDVDVYAALERLATMGMLQDDRGEGMGDHADGINPDGRHALDSAPLSALGRLASALPLDARLSRMVGLGVQLGCTAEAIVLAVACGLPRSPFRIISPLIHKDADSYNALVREGFLGRLHFDRGMYSEPLSVLSLLGELSGLDAAESSDAAPDAKEERRASRLNSARGVRWCQQHGLAAKEVRNLLSTLRSIRESIAPILGVSASSLVPPPGPFPSPGVEGGYKLSLLRALLVWCSHDSLISSAPLARRGPRADSQVRAIQLPVAVSDDALQRLLPPPLTWTCKSRGFDVVQVTRTRKGDDVACRLREAVTQRLLDALEPDLVFAFAPDGLCMWKREASVSKSAEAMIRDCLGDLFPAAGWGGLDDEGAPGWTLIEVSELSKSQRAALRHLSSRRGLAHDYSVATLHLIESGGASLTSTGCASLTEGLAELLPWAQRLIHELFGEEAVARALPGHSVPTKQLQFEGDERVVVAEGGPLPLVDDRHAGVRLLASMAAGYRDRRLYLGTALATETAAEEMDSARIGVKLDVPEGLEWFMVGSPEVAGARVLLGRHSLLKVALPSSRASMYAVGAAPLLLGSGGTLASMDMVTFLPPGDEWTELVLRCTGRSLPVGRNSHALAAQRNLADAIHSELLGADVEHLPVTSAKLRRLLEPWITHAALPARPDADSTAAEVVANERARECSICFEELHESGQLPSLPCPTCSNRFHPTCLFTWFGSHDGGGRNRCPLCKSEMS